MNRQRLARRSVNKAPRVGRAAAPMAQGQRQMKTGRRITGGHGFCVVEDSDYIGQVKLPAGESHNAGEALFQHFWSPSSVAGSRLQMYSRMYERYEVESLAFEFTGATPSTFAGSYVAYADYDPGDDNVVDPLQCAKGHPRAVEGKFWEAKTLRVPAETGIGRRILWCAPNAVSSDDTRMHIFCRLSLLALTDVAAPDVTVPLLSLSVRYKIRFYTEQLQAMSPAAISNEANTLPITAVPINSGSTTAPAAVPLDADGNHSTGPVFPSVAQATRTVRETIGGYNAAADAANVVFGTALPKFPNANSGKTYTYKVEKAGRNIVVSHYNRMLWLEPGCYTWFLTLSGCNELGNRDSVTFPLQLLPNPAGVFNSPVVLQPYWLRPANDVVTTFVTDIVADYSGSIADAQIQIYPELTLRARFRVLKGCFAGLFLSRNTLAGEDVSYFNIAAGGTVRVSNFVCQTQGPLYSGRTWATSVPARNSVPVGGHYVRGPGGVEYWSDDDESAVVESASSCPWQPAEDAMEVDFPESDGGPATSGALATTAQQLAASATLQALPQDVRARLLKAAAKQ